MFPKPSPESPVMFESRLLDTFSRTHPAVIPIVYVPLAALAFWLSVAWAGQSVGVSIGLFAMGLLTWTFIEYWAHRKLFHWIPDSDAGRRMHFIMHGVHHEWPNDKYRLVLPPGATLFLLPVVTGLFWLLLRSYSWGFLSGFIIGYMTYDLLHYYIHHFAPQHPWFKKLRRHHMIHHFKHEAQHRKFGVSSTLWDHIFRTY